jgi:hypothetical protein
MNGIIRVLQAVPHEVTSGLRTIAIQDMALLQYSTVFVVWEVGRCDGAMPNSTNQSRL